MREFRILVTGGGTGGHILPLISVVKKLRDEVKPSEVFLDIRYFGDPGPFRNELSENGIQIVPIVPSKLRRYFDIRNFYDVFRFIFGLFQSIGKVFLFMPDAAFSKGGPGALAVLTACKFYRIPIVLHESDAVPGITNRISATSAALVLIAFSAAAKYFPSKTNVKTVGLPVRDGLAPSSSIEESRKRFHLEASLPLLLFLGGSQGAEPINTFLIEHAAQFLDSFQILHQVGPKNYEQYKNEYLFMSEKFSEDMKKRYVFVPFLNTEDLGHAMLAADIVIARAGATTIFEIASVGKPAILIPLPNSANDHQRQNAYEYEKAGAAIVVLQENLLPNLLRTDIENLLKNGEMRRRMSEAAKKFFIPDAAGAIARGILEAAGK